MIPDALRVTVNGVGSSAPVPPSWAIDQVARAHRAGQRWDVRVQCSSRRRTRAMTETEAAELVAAVAEELS